MYRPTILFRWAFTLVILLGLTPQWSQAQTCNYTVSGPSAGVSVDVGGTSVSLGDDAVTGAINLGFNFNFFGTNFTQAYISSNGFVALSNEPNGCCSGQFLPNTGQPNNLIAGYWEDLNPGLGGTIGYNTFGTAPNRRFVVTFNQVQHFGGGNPVVFQIKLYETSNVIQTNCISCISDGGLHTQGIENQGGTSAFFVSGRNSADWSSSNQTVTFTPVSSSAPSGISGNTSICQGASTTLSVSGGSLGSGAVWRWFTGSCGGTSVGTGSSITVAPSSSTTYFVRAEGCQNTACASVVVTVNPSPAAPNPVTASPSTICSGSSSNLNATSSGNTIRWFTAPSGGTLLGTSASGANFSVSPTTTTTYYAESQSVGSSSGSQTFNYTGGIQTFTVPAGVTSLSVDLRGASGGAGSPTTHAGGLGGRATGTIAVTPGQVLQIYVGGAGGTGNVNGNAPGGFNGGGLGGFYPGSWAGGGGGGASDIRFSPYGTGNRVAVAGGGGGGGFNYGTANYDRGGNGGGTVGENGYGGNINAGQGAGTGGSQVTGGIGGTYSGYCTASNGGFGPGGNAGTCGSAGGGGGGGYYGGGGGTWSGAGGGSSFPSGFGHTQGFQSGNGQVIISWTGGGATCNSATRTPVTVTVNQFTTANAGPNQTVCGTTATLAGNAPASGTGTWTLISGSGTITSPNSPSSGVTGLGVGLNTFRWTLSNGVCAVSTDDVVITRDNVPPTITCPANITANAASGSCAANVSYSTPTGNDNCSGVTVTRTAGPASGASFPVGTTTVTHVATDGSGLTASCSFSVTVLDNQNPTISCPANITVNAAAGTCAANVTYTTPTGADNCPGVSVARIGGLASGSSFPLGTTTITYQATDAAGRTAICSFGVTVEDNQNPTITCPSNITVNAASGTCAATVSYTTPSAIDNCPGVTVARIAGPASGSSFPVGTTTVTYQATDGSGNTATCSFTVTVVDNQNPTITCPSNITVNAASGTCAANVSYSTPTASDNCPGVTVTRTAGPASGASFPVGTTTVTHTATDASGRTASCSFTVTVVDNQNPTITCPSNITVNAASGTCAANVTYTTPTASDNCPGVTVTRTAGPASGSSFPVGTTTVTHTATDAAGRTASCSFTVTVEDNQNPTITCPSNITVNAASGSCAANVTYTTPTATDNCPGVTVARTAGPASGASFPVGTTTVTHTATDAAGNTASCSFTVTVVDNQNPTITCPANITVNAASGTCAANVTYTTPTAADNCPGVTVTRTAGPASGSSFPVGTTTVTHTATDASGRTASCSFTVTVVDNQNPTITCPSNITVNAASGTCAANVTYTTPTATDNCPGVTVARTAGPASGSSFPVGTTTVTHTATDAAGRTASCSFTVTVVDNQNPTITCPSNITVNAASGTCAANVTYTTPTATDNCPGVTVARTAGPASGSSFPVGTTTVTHTATDAAGRTASCSFTVTVVDNQNPAITCPANITVSGTQGATPCTAPVTYTAPVGTDNCPGSTTTRTAGLASGSLFPQGTTTVTYTVTDGAGNTASCSFTVTVGTCNQAPIAICRNLTLPANSSCQATATASQFNNGSTDPDGDPLTFSVSPAGPYPLGTTNVVLTVSDPFGASSTCTASITVVDQTNPTISCPSNITVNASSGTCGAAVTYTTPTATDNCPGVTVSRTAGLASGSTFPVGTTTVTHTATDGGGNTASCSFTVTVIDNQPPVVNCPSNITVNAAPGACANTVSWTPPVGTDNCPGVTTTRTAGQAPGSSFAVGTSTITYTSTDASGNTDDCSFSVTVVDNQNPTITCPSSILINNNAGLCSGVATFFPPFGSDNCAGSTTTQTAGLGSGSAFPVGITTNIYTVVDASGNTATCSFTVTVVDNEDPALTCPANITVPAAAGTCAATVTFTAPVGTDNCPGVTTVRTAGQASGSSFTTGIHTQTYTATDAAGNTRSCSFTIRVQDTQVPIISGCPSNITLNTIPGTCNAIATWTPPTATDNCALASLSTTTPSGSSFPAGVNTVTYVATDTSGNFSLCSFNVTVNDIQPPVITNCPANISTNTDPGVCGALVSWTPPNATDNCGLNSFFTTHSPGTSFPVGTTTVTYTAADNAGNSATCSFTVTVVDNQNPTITGCPGNLTVNTAPGLCSATVSWSSPTASDNCILSSLVGTHTSGSSFALGTTTVTYTATDNSGNTAQCSFTITVVDAQAPVISGCPANITVNAASGVCNAVVNWTAPTANDNCAVASFTSSHNPGATFTVGTTTVTYTATDNAGNVSTCSFTVTVVDNQNPVITGCPSNITLPAAPGACSNVATWTAPTATDNCGIATFTSTHTPGNTFPSGTTTVTYTATDLAGRIATCTFTVTILDQQAPVISNCPANITRNATAGTCGANVTWTAPTASDNCAVTSFTTNHAPGSNFPVGVTTVNYIALDAAGNADTCSFTVTVVDNQAPIIANCPSNITVNNTPGACSATVSWTPPTATDNCSVTSFTSTHTPGGTFTVGTTTVTYTALDAAGNTATCSFTVTVVDNQPPTITGCPGNITVNNAPGQCSAVVNWTAPTATDNCGSVTMVTNFPTGSTFPVGTTTVNYTATDLAGNVSTCSFTVTVVDAQPPVIVCPANITIPADPGTCAAVVSYTTPVGTDNCPGSTTAQTAGLSSGSTFPLGTTTNTFTVTDAAGQTASCSFNVVVTDNQLPVITCPSNITVNNTPGICGAAVSYTISFSDNCPGATSTQTAGLASGTTFPVGTTTNSFTVTDGAGNTASCSFTVTVNDNENPTITCPSNITVNAAAGLCSAPVTFTVNFGDNCPGSVLSQTAGLASGTQFPVGTTTNTYVVTDAAGNTNTCSFTVTVVDNQAPVATCPANISVNNAPGQCNAVVTYSVTASDNCPGATTAQTGGQASGSSFPVGTTTNTFVVTDASGNTDTCSFTVTVVDNQVPVITCPANITVPADNGSCAAVVSYSTPVGTDNCPGSVTVQSSGLASGASFPLGSTTNTFTVTDAAGLTASCSFNVVVTDNQLPVITCPANINVNNTPGICGAAVSYTVSFSDNCPGATSTQTAGLASGATFPVGTTTNSFTVTDGAGNTASCSFTVTVNDNQNPTITCPSNITVNATTGQCTAPVTYTVNFGDNCPGSVLSQTAGSVSTAQFPVGTTTNSFLVTDAAGNTNTCSFTVTVLDNQPPVANCPANITVNNAPGQCDAVVTFSVTASDNCPGATTAQIGGQASGTAFAVGTTSNTFVVTDASGNTDTCSFTVTVVDNQNPVINCPANITVPADSGVCNAVVTYTPPTATDNCVTSIPVQTAGLASGATFPLGTTTNTFQTTDGSGNMSSCSFTVNVVDNQLPVIVCPANISVNNTPGLCGAAVTYTVTSSDNCSGSTSSQTAGLASGATFPVGTTTNTFVVTDGTGNTANCSFTVTVLDAQVPVITNCPANITVNNNNGSCSALVSWAAPSASDNCAVTSFTATHTSGTSFPVGTTTVTYTALDAAGNATTCSFTITVVDVQAPQLLSCPGNMAFPAANGLCTALVNWTPPTAVDNCGSVTLTSTHSPGTNFPVGATTVTYTATDASGNVTSCSFVVTILDQQNPVISGCPANIVRSNDLGLCSAVATWTPPTASDNCSVSSLTSTHTPGAVFAVGVTTVTYTATDASGNTATCNFTVTVNDTELPAVVCPSNISVSNDSTFCTAEVFYTTPVGTDNCPGSNTVQTAGLPDGSLFPLGTTTNTFQVTDAAGNIASCSFTVTVSDNENPVLTCPSNITANASPGQCNASITYTVNTSDNCPGVVLTQTGGLPSSFSFPVGTTTNSFLSTDAAGNTSTCSFTVTIVDNQLPTIACPSNISVGNDPGTCGAVVTFSTPTGLDNCPGAVTVQTTGLAAGSTFPIGTTLNTFQVTDAVGQTATCSFTVAVADTEAPVITCPATITVPADSGLCTAVVTFAATTATDNCPGQTVVPTAGLTSGSAFPVGTTTQAYSAFDVAGNTSTCTFDVIVLDTQFPVIAACPNSQTVNVDSGACTATVNWIAPTASDNCTVTSFTSTHTPGSIFTGGTTTVDYVAEDPAGNQTVCSFNITVVDLYDPIITGCPAPISVNSDAGICGAVVTWPAIQASDNCQIATFGGNFASGDTFVVGLTTVVYMAVDSAGNADTCTFTVNVTDVEAPVFSGCPSNITAAADSNQCATSVNWNAPQAADNCAVATVVNSHSPGATFPIGTTTVTYTVTDVNGLTGQCTFDITVLDSLAPVFVCPANITVVADSNDCTPAVTWAAPTVTDNCNVASFTSNIAPGTSFNQGTTTVTYTATDSSGNTASCSFTVDVQPRPFTLVAVNQVVYPSGFNVSCNGAFDGSATAVVAGGCEPYSYAWSNNGTAATVSNLAPGTYTVTVTDGNGATFTQTIQVTEPAPIANFLTIQVDTPACLGDTAWFIAAPGFSSYAWSNGDVTSTTFLTNTGSLSITVVDSFGCVGTDAGGVTFLPFNDPVPVITPNGILNLCESDSIQLNAGGGYTGYQWYHNGVLVNGATGQFYAATDSGQYTVEVTNGFGCQAMSSDVNINMFTPQPSSLTQIGDTLFASPPGLNYQWFLNGQVIPGATNSSYVVSTNGFYQVQVTDSNGCTSMSDSTDVLLALEGGLVGGGFDVYPSPFDRDITVELWLNRPEVILVRVYSVTGVEVHRYSTVTPETQLKQRIHLMGMTAGVYVVEVEAGGTRWIKKVVKQ